MCHTNIQSHRITLQKLRKRSIAKHKVKMSEFRHLLHKKISVRWRKRPLRNLAFLVAQIKEDRKNVYVLLAGRVVQSEMGINKIEYLEDKSPEEKAARLSIARLLRSDSPLDYQLRQHLAALFDPEEDTYPGGARRLVFKDRRNRGRYRDHFRNTQIVAFITERVEKNRPHQPQLKQRSSNRAYLRKSLESAVCDAVNKFGVKERQIWNILGTLQQT